MSANKLALILGMTGKVEASYAAGGSLSASTDGILLAELAELNEAFAHDGSRAAPPGTTGTQPQVAPTGSFLETTVKIEPKGFGAAYSAGNVPANIHALMRAAGHDAAVTTTGGLEKWVYTPTPGVGTFASLVAGFYSRGSLWSAKGLYADFGWGVDGPKVPLMEFGLKGLFTSVADTAVPAITYLAPAVNAPAAINMVITLGGVTGFVAKKFMFKKNRGLSPRMDINGAGHAGFSPGRRAPTLEVTIEEPATATYDARAKRRSGILEALSFQVGTVQYNRGKFAAPAAQLIDVKPSEEDSSACLDLTFAFHPSAVGLNDEYAITFD